MDFMRSAKGSQPMSDFEASKEMVSRDPFFALAKRYISTDEETILSRQALFSDILKIEGLSDFLIALSEKMMVYAPLTLSASKTPSAEESLHRILYPTAYTELVTFLFDGLSPFRSRLSSESMKQLYEAAKHDIESAEFKRIQSYYEKNFGKLRSVNSVTVGVNLDALYRPTEAGILSLNETPFKSGDLFDRIIKLDFEKDGFHCIAPLTVIDQKLGYQESQLLNQAVLKAMGRVLDSGLHFVGNRSLRCVKEKLAAYVERLDTLSFVAEAIKRMRVFQEKKIPLCFPTVSPDRAFRFRSLYAPSLCRLRDKKEIVPNTVDLEHNVCCYLLTGPNSGGKTVFLKSLADAQSYFQLGMPIPAKEASLPICDAIFYASAEEQAKSGAVGRFEKECIRLSEVLKSMSENSLVLIDEAFTATSSSEALPIAESFLSELCKIGGKCVFVTHYHELCDGRSQMADRGERIGYLHTEAQGNNRTYAVRSGKAAFGSYAQSIARKYGLIAKEISVINRNDQT